MSSPKIFTARSERMPEISSFTRSAIGCETEPVSKNDGFRAFAERVEVARTAPENERHEFVVGEGRDAEAFELLAWTIVRGDVLHFAILRPS
mgnify:CR=1 FL=1